MLYSSKELLANAFVWIKWSQHTGKKQIITVSFVYSMGVLEVIFHDISQAKSIKRSSSDIASTRSFGNRCDGVVVRVCFALGRPGVHSLSRVIPKDFKKWHSQLPCLSFSIKKG